MWNTSTTDRSQISLAFIINSRLTATRELDFMEAARLRGEIFELQNGVSDYSFHKKG